MPFKHNAARRHRIPRARYRVTNWPVYEAGVRRCLTRRSGHCPGAPARRGRCGRRSQQSACASPTGRLLPVPSTCRARSAGWCASTAQRASASFGRGGQIHANVPRFQDRRRLLGWSGSDPDEGRCGRHHLVQSSQCAPCPGRPVGSVAQFARDGVGVRPHRGDHHDQGALPARVRVASQERIADVGSHVRQGALQDGHHRSPNRRRAKGVVDERHGEDARHDGRDPEDCGVEGILRRVDVGQRDHGDRVASQHGSVRLGVLKVLRDEYAECQP